MSIKVEEIVSEFLKKQGYDGLFNQSLECGCLVEDLAPCGDMQGQCRAGYRRLLSKEEVESGDYGYLHDWFDGFWVICEKHEEKTHC